MECLWLAIDVGDTMYLNDRTKNDDEAVIDNRALGILCYNPEFTFVEKLQTISRSLPNFVSSPTRSKNISTASDD